LQSGNKNGGIAAASIMRSTDKYYYNNVGVLVWP
jgi:hypothetical protein